MPSQSTSYSPDLSFPSSAPLVLSPRMPSSSDSEASEAPPINIHLEGDHVTASGVSEGGTGIESSLYFH